jgi:CRP/FNR family cyclic AMP-dependent transcriptional regulator
VLKCFLSAGFALLGWALITVDQPALVAIIPSSAKQLQLCALFFPSGRIILGRKPSMLETEEPAFDAVAFLTNAGHGRNLISFSEESIFFSQGDVADSVFYLRCGRAKLTAVSKDGQEATITLLAPGDFVGEETLESAGALHSTTATAMTDCKVLKIDREEMLCRLHKEPRLSEIFMTFLLARGIRIQSDLVDHLFNSCEMRLARTLLSMANFGGIGKLEKLIPEITEESLAEMIGTSQTSVSFFMNRFRDLGFIDYDGRIRVHQALLSVVLRDRLPGENGATPEIVDLAS